MALRGVGRSSVRCLGKRLSRCAVYAARCGQSTLSSRVTAPNIKDPEGQPKYYNFATQAAMATTSTRRPRRLTSSSSSCFALDEQLPLDHMVPVDEKDPYSHVRIFRRDMAEGGGGRAFPLSVDVPQKKFLDMFWDFEGKRCKLCNESILQWHSHQGAIPHGGREGILLELVRAYCGTPEEIVKMWWHRLNTSNEFDRIPFLSDNNSHVRKRKLQFLLRLLKDRQVIVDTFSVMKDASQGAGRSWEFERLEFVGDNVVKYVLNNRINCLFPVREGGVRGKLGQMQFVMDGNEGLARLYDFLELQHLTQSDRVVSKFKSDVVETLFGELQWYLLSTEVDVGTEYLSFPFTKEMITLRALVSHVMEELAHVMVMYHIEVTLSIVQRVVREHQLQYVKADPALRGQAELQNELAHSLYAKKSIAQRTKSHLSTHKESPRSAHHGASLYQESTNYDSFKRVTPLGGLLPRPFSAQELSVTPTYMPHLQVDAQVVGAVAPEWDKDLCHELIGAQAPKETTEGSASHDDRKPFALHSEAIPSARCGRTSLDVPRLKDEGLVTELL